VPQPQCGRRAVIKSTLEWLIVIAAIVMGYTVTDEYVEHENGGKGVENRKQLAAMFFCGAARWRVLTSCSYGGRSLFFSGAKV
jgi:hypothetical protein